MTCAAIKKNIDDVAVDVTNASYKERLQDTESLINALLDKILEVQKILRDKALEVDSLAHKLEELTWLPFHGEEETLKAILKIIALANDYAKAVDSNYFHWGTIQGAEVATKEVTALKSSVEDFLDICNDLESAYFNLPKIEGFNELTQKLASR